MWYIFVLKQMPLCFHGAWQWNSFSQKLTENLHCANCVLNIRNFIGDILLFPEHSWKEKKFGSPVLQPPVESAKGQVHNTDKMEATNTSVMLE